MSEATDNLKARLAVARLRLEVIKAKKIGGGGYNRHPAGTPQGGQFAPKGAGGGTGAAGGSNTFHEVGGPGWGHYAKPASPPPGAKPHPAGVNDKGQPVTVNYPSKPSGKETWANKDKTATFVPGGETPSTLNNVPMKSWSPPKEGWHAVGGNNERLEALFPFERPGPGKSTGAGVLIVEPDGRIWLTKPTNEFGGYKQTYPKGTVESGLTMQQNAIKEAWEETGLKVKITGVLGDYDRTTSRARMYIAERVGGTPKDMGWESQAVRLATMKDAKSLLNMSHDKQILDDLEALISIGKSKGGAWQNQPRWPAGSPLGGQWKTMGADGLTVPPLIAGGLEKSNANYQKAVNAAHAAAQQGDVAPAKALMEKYGPKYQNFLDKVPQNSHGKWSAQSYQYAAQLLIDVAAKGTAAAAADRISGPEKLFSMMKVGEKPGGSNPGALYVDKSGTQWLVKGSNAALTQDAKTIEDRSKNEVLAAKLMLAAGVGAPDMKLVDLEGQYNGGLGVASKWVDGLKKLSTTNHGDMGAARADFAVHAWLANYDALGMGLDNTMIKDGKAINIDTGGALLFRAQGAKKDLPGGLLDASAPEFESMRKTTSEQKLVYGKMTTSDLKASAEKLNNISDDTIRSLVKTYGPGNEAFRDKLAQNLIDRKNAILSKAGLPFSMNVGVATPPSPTAAKAPKASAATDLTPPEASAFKGDKADIKAEIVSDWKALHDKALKGDTTALKDLLQQTKTSLYNIQHPKPSSMSNENWKDTWTRAEYAKKLIANLKANLNEDGSLKTANAPKTLPTPTPTKQEVEAKLVANAMQAVNSATTAMKNALATSPNMTVKGPVESASELVKSGDTSLKAIAETMNKAYLAGDISALALAKAGADAIMKGGSDINIKDDATSLSVFATQGMKKLAFDAAKASLTIAENAPKIEVPPKPTWPNEKFGNKYYSGLADKAEALAKAGDLAGLKAMATSGKYEGGVPWKPGSPNGKVMAAYHAALVAKLEQKDAAVVVARVNQAQKAMEQKIEMLTPAEAAQKALPAMPDFESKKLPAGNTNASSHNAKVDTIAKLAAEGNVNGLLSLKYGTNTYGKKQAQIANDALAALGSAHVVVPGQKANAHPALFGGVTAEQATAAAATVNVAPTPPHPATKEKGKPVFKPENLTAPPNFKDWNGTGKGLSSKDYVNEANNEAVKLIFATAQKGDPLALAQLTYAAVNKETGATEGTKLMKDHPSQHVKAYQSNLIQEIDLQLNPPKMPRLGVITHGTLEEISAALAPVPAGKSVAAVPKNQKAGKYIVLGKANPVQNLPKADDSVASSAAWKKSAVDHYNAAPSDARETFSHYVTTSGARALNTALREGNLATTTGGKSVKKHVEDFNKLLVDIPEGSTFVRNMGNSGYGQTPNKKEIADLQQFLMSAEKGTVVQEPGFSSSSWGKQILGNNDIQWQFTAGKGVKAFPAWLSANMGEGESLFPPNQRYMITGAKKKGKTVVVEAVLLPYVDPTPGP